MAKVTKAPTKKTIVVKAKSKPSLSQQFENLIKKHDAKEVASLFNSLELHTTKKVAVKQDDDELKDGIYKIQLSNYMDKHIHENDAKQVKTENTAIVSGKVDNSIPFLTGLVNDVSYENDLSFKLIGAIKDKLAVIYDVPANEHENGLEQLDPFSQTNRLSNEVYRKRNINSQLNEILNTLSILV